MKRVCWRKGVYADFGHPYVWDTGRVWGFGMYMTTPNVVTVMRRVYEDIAMSPLPIVGVILIRVVHAV